MTEISDEWIEAVVSLGGDRARAADAAQDLVARYAELHRRYHLTAHVEAVLRDSTMLAEELALTDQDRALLSLAACAHDVVYNAEPGADEHASALWARSQLAAAGIAEALIARIEELVLFTLTHTVEKTDVPGSALLDADLAILAADESVYDQYSKDVRVEFAAVPDDLWLLGRAHVLRGLLAHEPLFLTAPGRHRWEVAARANLGREIAALMS